MALADDLTALAADIDRIVADDQAKTAEIATLKAQVASLDPNAAADLATAQAELASAQTEVATLQAKIEAVVPVPVPFAVTALTVSGTTGQALSPVAIAVTGGTAPFTFSVSGTLPDGVGVDTLGNVSGTPTAAFTGDVTVTATDSTSATASGTVSFNIA